VERATFFERLRHNRLLTEPELEQAASRFTNDDPVPNIAGALVNEGVLTHFQARHLCAGDTQPLTLGQYRILDELGRGGMGRVYKALHTIMGRVVAIKVISPELVQNPIAVEWFRREVRASTHLVHPNIVMAYDANEAEGLHFLVMEYVEGVTLDALLKQSGPLPIENACALMRQAALGLQHAQEKGMVHRDIKPGNLLIPRTDGDQPAEILVKIVDFGLARLQNKTSGDTIQLRPEAGVLGTPDFISPEQSRDIHAADIRSDLYSLGCTFYLTLAGRVPFPGETAVEKLIKHLMEEPEPLEKVRPDVPPAVAAVVKKLMAKDPANRYQTPAELVRALDACATEQPKESSATPTLCRPLWISPPTHVGGGAGAAGESPAPTRLIEGGPVFLPSRQEVELSGPSLFEPPWKYAPGDKQRQPTHDTLTGSKAEDTELVTAEATAGVPAAPPAPRVDSDSTQPEVSAAAAASQAAVESASGPPERIAPALLPLWRRWRALLQTIINGSGPARVDAEAYRTAHTQLLYACREAAEVAVTPERRSFYQELISIIQPWLNLQTFVRTEPEMLHALLERCRQAELELNGGKVPWTARQFVGLILLALSPIGLAVWYWNSGRLWLPSLVRAFQWDSSKPSMHSAWDYVATHPSLLMGVIFPVVIVFSIFLLVRTPRT
jgi:serine/threonine protein kinase